MPELQIHHSNVVLLINLIGIEQIWLLSVQTTMYQKYAQTRSDGAVHKPVNAF